MVNHNVTVIDDISIFIYNKINKFKLKNFYFAKLLLFIFVIIFFYFLFENFYKSCIYATGFFFIFSILSLLSFIYADDNDDDMQTHVFLRI